MVEKYHVIDPGFPGAGRVLQELCEISGDKIAYWNSAYISVEALKKSSPEMVFIPAWHPNYKYIVGDWTKVVVLWTSPPLQTEFVPQEIEYIRNILHLCEKGDIYSIWFGDERWIPIVRSWNARKFYCPYPVTLPGGITQNKRKDPPKNVSLFGPLHPRKNVLPQIVAASKINATLYITDPGAVSLLNLFGGKYKTYGWLSSVDYGNLVSMMDLGLQVSVPGVESFSYVTWDHLSRGIPCLTSVEWTPKHLQVDEPFNADDIFYYLEDSENNFKEPKYYRDWAITFAGARNRNVKDILKTELDLHI